jgi:hypothetical protein
MNLACLECAQRAGTPESRAAPSHPAASGYQCATCRTQWRRGPWGHWQSESAVSPFAPAASPYWPYA